MTTLSPTGYWNVSYSRPFRVTGAPSRSYGDGRKYSPVLAVIRFETRGGDRPAGRLDYSLSLWADTNRPPKEVLSPHEVEEAGDDLNWLQPAVDQARAEFRRMLDFRRA